MEKEKKVAEKLAVSDGKTIKRWGGGGGACTSSPP